MTRRERAVGLLIALAVGVALAAGAWRWINDPQPRAQRAAEEAMVLAARRELSAFLGHPDGLVIVDALNRNRVAGKGYIYPADEGWEVSGFYRGPADPRWYGWQMTIGTDGQPLSVRADSPRGTLGTDTRE